MNSTQTSWRKQHVLGLWPNWQVYEVTTNHTNYNKQEWLGLTVRSPCTCLQEDVCSRVDVLFVSWPPASPNIWQPIPTVHFLALKFWFIHKKRGKSFLSFFAAKIVTHLWVFFVNLSFSVTLHRWCQLNQTLEAVNSIWTLIVWHAAFYFLV